MKSRKKFFNNKKDEAFFFKETYTINLHNLMNRSLLDMRLFKHKIFIPAIFSRNRNIETYKNT